MPSPNPLKKAKALEKRALSELDRRRAQAIEARKTRWQRLQKESPDTAEWISTMSELFGKPAALAVKFDGEEWERWK